ncbi:carbonate dehydratase [Paenibacillus sacheonensis]|uniref:Carbonate dehydratase n=1 Tax=Paenibacillus sacheonensis TaxID=742054 RepID=A0A7X4YQ14_9BACL|nr:carbonate dehydratase [Paenibacillus sacheonensis]MBM7566165.1 carbon dioxide concentrating mechanism protein CcmM [Paenibacillus sacheonensis]NBC70373.1 carbonate dehydratase [Paenibacillus sacheonensis]
MTFYPRRDSVRQQDSDPLPRGPVNVFARFIGPNPITSANPVSRYPSIHPSAFLGPFTSVIGDVRISDQVFVAPTSTLRADEGTPFFIGSRTNIQDGVILHGLANRSIQVANKPYSIFIGNRVSIAHGAIVHGPCLVEDDAFIGFKAILFNAYVGRGSYISNDAILTNGVRLAPNRFVPPGAHIDTQVKADSLAAVPKDAEELAEQVIRVYSEFPPSYDAMFGTRRCSCGIAYNHTKL